MSICLLSREIKEESEFTLTILKTEDTVNREFIEAKLEETLPTESILFPQLTRVKTEPFEEGSGNAMVKNTKAVNVGGVKSEEEDEPVKTDKEESNDLSKNQAIEAQRVTKHARFRIFSKNTPDFGSQLHREVDPLLNNFLQVEPGKISYSDVGGLAEQIDKLREFAELPVINPELFRRIGISPFNSCLLFGPPGTGKTLLASALESQLDCAFIKVVSSAIVDKYIGESARIIREMFNYARDHQPCIVFMDEIDAIGGRRFPKGTSADREIQRTLVELLNQLDRIDSTVKVIMATNRPDTLDPALLRPGRLDRKIEIGLPNEQSRLEILKIHSNKITKHGEIDFQKLVKLSAGFSGAHLKNMCIEAGMFAIRADRESVTNEDFMKAVREVGDVWRLETKLDYKPV
ncbi:hypothetical protein CRE_14579 [Caenorhabditis remanei]|uniref:AAA+ ATPase domain-containing protein n=1 Tax=Caenorhabditis remanei TaxID=31234 RepID=E3M9M3_CAERE|nr:hypothetical protein CRE_14579 [Caenorhabditis remanei]